jgi:hypothetical protein
VNKKKKEEKSTEGIGNEKKQKRGSRTYQTRRRRDTRPITHKKKNAQVGHEGEPLWQPHPPEIVNPRSVAITSELALSPFATSVVPLASALLSVGAFSVLPASALLSPTASVLVCSGDGSAVLGA